MGDMTAAPGVACGLSEEDQPSFALLPQRGDYHLLAGTDRYRSAFLDDVRL